MRGVGCGFSEGGGGRGALLSCRLKGSKVGGGSAKRESGECAVIRMKSILPPGSPGTGGSAPPPLCPGAGRLA